jgi:cysteinyl-tRNA synthetase
MIAGARVEVAPYKRHPADFVLWKPSKENEPEWPSPFGPGRPGWHIECTAMIEQALGLPIDIHGGGIDLVFPHHENELAQGICSGHGHGEYAGYWLHNGFLNMGDEKMSKSVGNVALAHDLLKLFPGEAIRWALLSGHYRQPLEWNDGLIEQAKSALDRLYRVLDDCDRFVDGPLLDGVVDRAVEAALHDDLNTPSAMAALFVVADDLRSAIMRKDADRATDVRANLVRSAQRMGFLMAEPKTWFQGGADDNLKTKVEALLADRLAARAAKNWPEADRIRAELTALNVEVMDGPSGATWRIKEQA